MLGTILVHVNVHDGATVDYGYDVAEKQKNTECNIE